jgi:uncharacterized protein YlzI (FlbEa/FlbD family)
MIHLTLIKGESVILNADQILQIERAGDTIIVCNNGNKYRVKEDPSDIINLCLDWHQKKWIPKVSG